MNMEARTEEVPHSSVGMDSPSGENKAGVKTPHTGMEALTGVGKDLMAQIGVLVDAKLATVIERILSEVAAKFEGLPAVG